MPDGFQIPANPFKDPLPPKEQPVERYTPWWLEWLNPGEKANLDLGIFASKGSNLVELPPEWGGEGEGTEEPGNYGWGDLGAPGKLPPDLDPRQWYEMMAQSYPYELYMAQYNDWVNQKLMKMMQDKPNYPSKEKFDDDWDKMVEGINRDKKMMVEFIKSNFPLESFPEYAAVKKVQGRNVEKAYVNYATNYITEQKKIVAQQQAAHEDLFGEMGKRYGSQIASAVRKGFMTPQDAEIYSRNLARTELLGASGYTGGGYNKPYTGNYQALQEAVDKGWLTVGEAFGEGSAYDRYYKEKNKQINQQAGAQKGAQELAKWRGSQEAQEAKALSVDTSMYEQALASGIMPAVELNKFHYQVATGITKGRMMQTGEEAGMLALEYPELYQKFLTDPEIRKRYGNQAIAAKGGGYQGDINPLQFYNWTQGLEVPGTDELQPNPEFQRAYTEKEAGRWRDYGEVYPAYQKARRGMGITTFKPFEKWLEEEPSVSGWARQRKLELEEQRRRREAYLAPPMR